MPGQEIVASRQSSCQPPKQVSIVHVSGVKLFPFVAGRISLRSPAVYVLRLPRPDKHEKLLPVQSEADRNQVLMKYIGAVIAI